MLLELLTDFLLSESFRLRPQEVHLLLMRQFHLIAYGNHTFRKSVVILP